MHGVFIRLQRDSLWLGIGKRKGSRRSARDSYVLPFPSYVQSAVEQVVFTDASSRVVIYSIRKVENMSTTLLAPQLQDGSEGASIQQQVSTMIDDLITQLPNPQRLTDEERRGIIARYTSVLEGNFIYWMTATYLATHSEDARLILIDNLMEEVRDSHPVMLRKFTMAANAFPSSEDVLAVHATMTKMRLFLGRLQGVQSLVTMAFFEGFIQKYMPFLAALAAARGSKEMEYTDVHGVCDVAHSEGLFRAVLLENSINPISAEENLFEGVELLCKVIGSVMHGPAEKLAA